mgnify:CR=1 FL=1
MRRILGLMTAAVLAAAADSEAEEMQIPLSQRLRVHVALQALAG